MIIQASKPVFGTRINRAHPWFTGMQGFYALNEASGAAAYDATGNINLAATGFGTANPWFAAAQPGVLSNATNECFYGVLPTSFQYGWPITIAVAFRNVGVANSNGGDIFSGTYASPPGTNSAPYDCWTISKAATSNAMRLAYNSGGTQVISSPGFTFQNNSDYVAAATFTTAGQYSYVLGKPVASGTSASNPTYSSTASITVGGFPFAVSQTPNVLVYWAAWWNRVLSAAEHQAIGCGVNAIYQMFPARTVLSPGSSKKIYVPYMALFNGANAGIMSAV
jgi:hypothetical protein